MVTGRRTGERRRIQNRMAQQRYRKSVLKRVEELEKRNGIAPAEKAKQQLQWQTPTIYHHTHDSVPRRPLSSTTTRPAVYNLGAAFDSAAASIIDEMPTMSDEATLLSPRIGQQDPIDEFNLWSQAHYHSSTVPEMEQQQMSTYQFSNYPTPPDSIRGCYDTSPVPNLPIDHSGHNRQANAVSTLVALSHTDPQYGRRPSLNQTPTITALHKAVTCGYEAIVEILLQKRPNLEIRDHNNNTALQIAIESDNCRVAALLLEAGSNPNVDDGAGGDTALHVAIERGNPQMVALLLEYGAHTE